MGTALRRVLGIALAALLAGCELLRGPEEENPPPEVPVEDTDPGRRLGPTTAEPAWRDLTRHTQLVAPNRATHPGPSRDGRFFAYVTTEFGPRPQIALRAANGAAATQITANGADNYFPRVSPDGRHVAYCSNRHGNFDIFVARIDAPSTTVQVTSGADDDIAPSWSPDGRKLVYCTMVPEGYWRLVISDVGTSVTTWLGPGLYPDWSPDPKDPWIAFQSQPRAEGGKSTIWVCRPDGTQRGEIVGDKVGVWAAMNPGFSPDGRWIAYATVRRSVESRLFGAPEEADDIWIVRPDGTYDTRLTEDLSAEWWPAWGGNRVFFVSTRHGTRNVYSVQPKPLGEEN